MIKKSIASAIIALGFILLLTSCTGIYKFIGLTQDQADDQTAKDQAFTQDIIETGREQIWQLTTAAVTAAGAIASGFLGRWLGTERKITATLISGIESADFGDLKKIISTKATSAGIEPQLNKRVHKLT